MNGASADHNGIDRSPEQAHDEAVPRIGTADRRPAGAALDLEADDPIESGNKISNDVRPLSRASRKMQIATVQVAQPFRKRRLRVPLLGLDESPYELHCRRLSCKRRRAGPSSNHEAKLLAEQRVLVVGA